MAGADSAIDLIFKESAREQASIEPNVMTPQPVQARTTMRSRPASLASRYAPTMEMTGQQQPPAPQQEIAEDREFKVQSEDGEEISLTLKGDNSVWEGDVQLGKYDENGQFVYNEPSLLLKAGAKVLSGAEWAVYPFAASGMGISKVIEKAKKGEAYTPSQIAQFQYEKKYRERHPDIDKEKPPSAAYVKYWESVEKEPELKEYLPGGAEYEKYREKPWWQQLLYELPLVAATAGVTATGIKAGLGKIAQAGGKAAIPARIGAVAVTPAAQIETGLARLVNLPVRGIQKVVGKATPGVRVAPDVTPKVAPAVLPESERIALQQQLKKATAKVARLEKKVTGTSIPDEIRAEFNMPAGTAHPSYKPGLPDEWRALKTAQAEETRLMQELGLMAKPDVSPVATVAPDVTQPSTIPGTAKLVNVLRRHGDADLIQQAGVIRARALAGEAIDLRVELLPIIQRSPKVGEALVEDLRQIKLSQTLDSIPDYSMPMWAKLTPARRLGTVKAAGLGENVSLKSWKTMTDVEKRAINNLYITPEGNAAVERLAQSLDDMRTVYSGEQKFVRAGEMGQRVSKLKAAGATTPEEFTRAAGKALKGELPKTGVPPMTPEDGAEISTLCMNSPVLQYRLLDKLKLVARPMEDSSIKGGALWKLEQGILPPDNELDLLGEVLGKRVADSLSSFKGMGNKFIARILDLLNFPRALITAIDMSNVGRQSVVMAFGEPKLAARNFAKSTKAFFKQDAADEAYRYMRANPFYGELKKIGVTETHFTTEGAMGLREEPFLSRLANWVPGIKQSARAFTVMGNLMRFEPGYKYLATRPKLWRQDEGKWLARLLNWETGRGPVPQQMLPFLAQGLFSPGFVASRLAMPALPLFASPAVRALAIRHMIQFVGGTAGILVTGKFLGAWDLELDLRSTDFGKIRVGNTRIDPWGGFLPYFRFIVHMVTGEKKSQSGEIYKITDKLDEAERAIWMKAAPFPGFVRDILKGETVVGEELEATPEGIREQAWERLGPLFVQDLVDAIIEDGWVGGMVAIPGGVGAGIVSYPSRTFSNWLESVESHTGIDWDSERIQSIRPLFEDAEDSWQEYRNLNGERAQKQYRIDHPDVDASLFFWGESSQLYAKEESRAKVQKMIDDYGLTWDSFPIKTPTEPYERDGKSDDDIVGDVLDMLPSDVMEFYTENRDLFSGRDLEGYANLVQSMRTEDVNKVGVFKMLTMDTDSSVQSSNRVQYLTEHPDVDAAYNLWYGNVTTLHSTEAQTILLEKLKALGIPPEAIEISPGGVGFSTTPQKGLGPKSIRGGGTLEKYYK